MKSDGVSRLCGVISGDTSSKAHDGPSSAASSSRSASTRSARHRPQLQLRVIVIPSVSSDLVPIPFIATHSSERQRRNASRTCTDLISDLILMSAQGTMSTTQHLPVLRISSISSNYIHTLSQSLRLTCAKVCEPHKRI